MIKRKLNVWAIMMTAFIMLIISTPAMAEVRNGAQIDLFGFKFTIGEGSIEVIDDKLVLATEGSLDLSPVLGPGAVIQVKDLKLDNDSTLTMENMSVEQIQVGPFKASLAADKIVIQKAMAAGQNSSFNLKLKILIDVGGSELPVYADLPVVNGGLKDALIRLEPQDGKEYFFKKEVAGGSVTVNSGILTIKDAAFDSLAFSGEIFVFGQTFVLKETTVTPDGIEGAFAPPEGGAISLGSIGLGLTGESSFKVTSTGFDVTIGESYIDLAQMIPGSEGKLVISSTNIKDGEFHTQSSMVQAVKIAGQSINVENLTIDATKKPDNTTFVEIKLDGTLALNILEKNYSLKFSGLEINSDGLVKGDVSVPSPIKFDMFMASFGIDRVVFSNETGEDNPDGVMQIGAFGEITIGSDKIRFSNLTIEDGLISTTFDVSDDDPFALSWFQYLKLTQLEVDKNVMTIGGRIDLPEPVKYSFAFSDITLDTDGIQKAVDSAKDKAASAASAAKTAASEEIDRLVDSLTDPDTLTLENSLDVPLEIAGQKFYIDVLSIPNPLKAARNKSLPDTLLTLYMRSELEIMGKSISMNIDGLEITKSGLKDMTIDIATKDGKALFDQTLFGWASFKLDKAFLAIKGGQFGEFGFTGKVLIEGKGFDILAMRFKDNMVEGNLKAVGDPGLDLGIAKIKFTGDIAFKYAMTTGTSAGGGGPPAGQTSTSDSGSFELSISEVTLDLSAVLGSSARLSIKDFKIVNGSISATMSLASAIDLAGFRLNINSVKLESPAPAAGKARTFSANLNGSFTIPFPKIEVEFKNVLVSPEGIKGEMALPGYQEFEAFGGRLVISKIFFEAKGSNYKVGMSGGFALPGMKGELIGFKEVSYTNGKFAFALDVSEQKPFSLPILPYIKLTKLEYTNSELVMSGFLQLPSPINVKFVLTDLRLDSSGNIKGGKLEIPKNTKINVGLFVLVMSEASFDLQTKYFKFSGELRLPSDTFEGAFKFANIGIPLANALDGGSGGGAGFDTSQTKIDGTSGKDKKRALDLSISKVSFGFKDGEMFLGLSGDMSVSVGGKGFTLTFENFKITQSLKFSVGKVCGGIEIATFKIWVSNYEIGDDFFAISGGMSLPAIGGIQVEGLKVYKSGKIEMAGCGVKVQFKAFTIEVYMSYKDSTFKAKGTMIFYGKGVSIAMEIGPKKWSFDIDVQGLQIVLFPGIFLDGVGGGASYEYENSRLELRLRAVFTIGDRNMIAGAVEIKADNQGLIQIKGELKALTFIPLAEVEMTMDIPNKTVSGWAKINNMVGPVLVQTKVSLLISPNEWYIKAVATADLFGLIRVGDASFYIGSNGLHIEINCSVDFGVIKGGAHVKLDVSTSFRVTAQFSAHASLDLWIVEISGGVSASYADGVFRGRVYLEACVELVGCFGVSLNIKISSGSFDVWW